MLVWMALISEFTKVFSLVNMSELSSADFCPIGHVISEQVKKMDSLENNAREGMLHCIICQEKESSINGQLGGRALVKTSCNPIPHVYHMKCITEWLDKQSEEWALDQRQCVLCMQPALPLIKLGGSTILDDESPYCESLMLNACRTGDQKTIRMLLAQNESLGNRMYRSALTGHQVQPLTVAIEHDYADCARYLINSTTDFNGLLHTAARKGSVESLRFLANYADINAVDESGKTPLRIAAENGHITFLQALVAISGVDLDACDKDCNTLLHFAALRGQTECLKWLIHTGADINAANQYGNTPLHYVTRRHNRVDTLKALLNTPGILVNAKNNHGLVPLHFAAASCSESVRALLAVPGILVNEKDKIGNTPLHFAALSESALPIKALLTAPSILVNEKNDLGRLPLHEAARSGEADCVKELLTAPDILVNEKDNDGYLPLHRAVINGGPECVTALLTAPDIWVNEKDNDGYLPLHYAAQKGDINIVKALLPRSRHSGQ